MRLDEAVEALEKEGYKVRYAYHPHPGIGVTLEPAHRRGPLFDGDLPRITAKSDGTIVARGFKQPANEKRVAVLLVLKEGTTRQQALQMVEGLEDRLDTSYFIHPAHAVVEYEPDDGGPVMYFP